MTPACSLSLARAASAAASRAGAEAQRARLAGLWALVLRRFRAYAHRAGAAAANGDRHEEGK